MAIRLNPRLLMFLVIVNLSAATFRPLCNLAICHNIKQDNYLQFANHDNVLLKLASLIAVVEC
jgi:hypothetical protein